MAPIVRNRLATRPGTRLAASVGGFLADGILTLAPAGAALALAPAGSVVIAGWVLAASANPVLAAAAKPVADAPAHVSGSAGISLPSGQLSYKASSIELDYRQQQAVLRNVSMSQGGVSVTADRADVAGINRDDSRWTFTGNVHISSEQRGDLTSDRATVEIRNSRIRSAIATGHPARFEQTASKSGVLAHGHADSIEYTVDTGTVRLTDDAWLKYGDNEITGPVLVYNIKEQKLEGASGAGADDRIHITIQPRKGGKPGSKP